MTAPAANRTFGQWKILLILPDESVSRQLAPLIASHLPYSNTTELKEYPSRNELAALLDETPLDLCFVDVEHGRDWSLPVLADLSALNPKLPVVALHRGNDSEFILRTLRGGASEFLIEPFTSEQFIQVMERLSALHRGNRGGANAKVLLFAPAKGACGASTVASSIAFLWRKFGTQKILLADLDPYAGTISFQLKMKQSFSFMDALSRDTLDEEIWKGIVSQNNGVDVLLAPEQPVHGIDETHDPAPLVEFARNNYETVVIDIGGVYGRWSCSLANLSDEILLVTTNELAALQATQRSLAYLDRARIDRSKLRIVVNRFNRDFGLNRDVIEAALHADVVEIIPSDYDAIQKSLVDGKPVPQNSQVGRGILQLASKLSGRPVEESTTGKSSGLGTLFGSLFGKR
jgi:pilus assembly protein CpaE